MQEWDKRQMTGNCAAQKKLEFELGKNREPAIPMLQMMKSLSRHGRLYLWLTNINTVV